MAGATRRRRRDEGCGRPAIPLEDVDRLNDAEVFVARHPLAPRAAGKPIRNRSEAEHVLPSVERRNRDRRRPRSDVYFLLPI